MLTSYSAIEAATIEPAPTITVTDRGRELIADLHDWDPELDIAVLTVPEADLPPVDWIDRDRARDLIGENTFAMSGLGGQGGTISYGRITDQTSAGLRIDVPVGTDFRGAPLLTRSGDAIGIVSLDYAPLGFPPGEVHFVVPINEACGEVLDCGSSFGDEALETERTEAERAEAIANGEDPDAPPTTLAEDAEGAEEEG